ncbi:MAG: maleylacetoacetate isomerase [Sphingomonas bacterium]|nr:maleylacetoacetate isomerase [Sphingomonas bacterium]
MSRAILHDYFRSSAAYRVRIALNLKGVEYEQRGVNLASNAQADAAYRAINPQGFVPMLEIDGHKLTQSLAICDYLDANFEPNPFVAKDPAARSHILALALVVACDIHPLNNLRVLKYLERELHQPQDAKDDWYRHWVSEGLSALEAMAKPQAGSFLVGDAPTLADICLVPQLYNARRFGVRIDHYPTLRRAEESANALPAFAAAHPDRQEQPA